MYLCSRKTVYKMNHSNVIIAKLTLDSNIMNITSMLICLIRIRRVHNANTSILLCCNNSRKMSTGKADPDSS